MQCLTIYDYSYPWDQFWLLTVFGLVGLSMMAWELRAPSYPQSAKITRLRVFAFGLIALSCFAQLPYGAVRAWINEPATVQVTGRVTSLQGTTWRMAVPPLRAEICLDDACHSYSSFGVNYGFAGRLDLVDRVGRRTTRLKDHLRIGDLVTLDKTRRGEILHIAQCRPPA
jgi:hypothetical protein